LWLPITALGAFYLAREGVKWSDNLRAEVTITAKLNLWSEMIPLHFIYFKQIALIKLTSH
jgi:hypothetical protein